MPKLFLKGVQLGEIEGVLFDKDGTLTNSENYLHQLGYLRVDQAKKISQYKSYPSDLQKYLVNLLSTAYGLTSKGVIPGGILAVGSREQNLFSTATIFSLIGEEWPESMEIAKDIFCKVDTLIKSNDQTKKRELLPGVLNFIQNLNLAGVKCAVISNDTSSGIQEFLHQNQLEEHFDSFWSAENKPPKPNPGAVEGLCNHLQLKPMECALIGDANSDLKMAKEAGIGVTIGYLAGWSETPKLCKVQKFIHHWDEITIN